MAFWVILINILKVILKAKQLIGLLKGLSSGKLVQSLVSNFILGEIGKGLVKAGVPVETFTYLDQARNGISTVVDALSEDLKKSGIELKLDDLNELLLGDIRRFQKGLSIVGGVSEQRNQSRGADPVLFQRGEFERISDDLFVRGAGADLLLRRVYRSGADFLGPFGRAWDHRYNLRLVETDAHTVTRLTGNLSQTRFVRHPNFGQAGYDYFTPESGSHDVLEMNGAGSFQLRRPGGETIVYESVGQKEHRARAIEDAAGNRIDFDYDADNHLVGVFGNGPHRHLRFFYGAFERIERVEDHTGRACNYRYDDEGMLIRVEQWSEVAGVPALTAETYEYTAVGSSLRLSRISDERGRVLVENDYDTRPGSDTLGYILNQYNENGPVSFQYEHLPAQPAVDLAPADLPVLRVFETLPNGHVIERVFNEAGNELMRRDDYVDDGRIKTSVVRTRYNEDGAIIATMDAEGGLVQYVHGCEQANLGPWNALSVTLADITAEQRMGFGNQLAKVERGLAMDVLLRVAEQEQWIAALPDSRLRMDAADAIVKQVYDSKTQVLLSQSNVRATLSPDPLHVESAPPGTPAYNPGHPLAKAHRRMLTVHQCTPSGLRIKTTYPNRSRPLSLGGGELANIAEEMTAWDARGRPLSRRDRLGQVTDVEYYPDSAVPADGAKAGYPHRELRPHVDWTLDLDFPPLLEVRRSGAWTATALATVAASGAPASMRLELPCQRIALWRSADGSSQSICPAATVAVDGVAHGTWDQTVLSRYVIDGLAPGNHVVEVAAAAGGLALGRVVGHVAFTYDVDVLGRVVAATNPRGVVTRTTYDVLDRVLERTRGTGAAQTHERFAYDHDGAIEHKDARWRSSAGMALAGGIVGTRYHRNARRQVTHEVTRAPEQADRRVQGSYYDLLGVLVAVRNGRGAMTRWRIDALGRRVQETRAACSADRTFTTAAYDRCGRVLRARDGEGVVRLNGLRSGAGMRSGYDARGLLHFMTDALGHVTVTRFDLAGNETVVQRFGRLPDGSFELVERHHVAYDEHGDRVEEMTAILSQPVPASDPVSLPDQAFLDGMTAGVIALRSTTYELDANGRRRRVVNAGLVTRLEYDPQGRLADELLPGGRRLVRVYDGAGNVVRSYAFDPSAAGDPASQPAVFLETRQYDDQDRRIALDDAFGNRWQDRHDTLGNIEASVDPLGRRTERQYNAFAQEIERTEGLTDGVLAAAPATTRSAYDFCGNLVTLTDALGRSYAITYDLLDRKTSVRNASYPADPGSTYGYDRCGRLVRERDRNGLVRRHQHDAAGQLVRTDHDASGVAPADAPHALAATFLTVAYDALGRARRLENDWSVIVQARDSRGLLVEEQTTLKPAAGAGARTWRVAQSYDDTGARTGLVYPGGRAVSYKRDGAGRVSEVVNAYTPPDYPGSALTMSGATLARYRYAGGRWVGADYPLADAALAVAYDGRGQLAERLLTNGARTQTIWRQQILLDGARQTAVDTVTTTGNARSRYFSFDAQARLAGYTDAAAHWIDPLAIAPPAMPAAPGLPVAQALINGLAPPGPSANLFTFDAVGNRLTGEEGGLPAVVSTPDADNRYTTVAGAGWEYDPEGRLRADGTRRYAYDAEGNLTAEQALAGGVQFMRLVRDARGRVIAVFTDADAGADPDVHFLAYLDEQTPLTHWHGAQRTEYTPGGRDPGPAHIAAAGADQWIVADALRTPKVILQPGMMPAQLLRDHRPHGEAMSAMAVPDLYAFAGMLQFPGSALLHAAHRSYLPALGRFVQQDPAGFADGPNRYPYARNNPVDLYDPLGLQAYSPMTKARVEFLAEVRGIGHGREGVDKDRAVGRWFQNTLMRSFGLTENGRPFGTLARDLATAQGRSTVVPDAVTDQRYYKADASAREVVRAAKFAAFEFAHLGGKTFKDSTFWEFKAYREGKVIRLSDSDTQIKGMIDAASETEATRNREAPLPSSIHFVTTAGVVFSPEVIAYATSKDVELVHHVAEEYIMANGQSTGMRIGPGEVLNDIVVMKRGAIIVEQNAGDYVPFDFKPVRINLLLPRYIH